MLLKQNVDFTYYLKSYKQVDRNCSNNLKNLISPNHFYYLKLLKISFYKRFDKYGLIMEITFPKYTQEQVQLHHL